MTKSPECLVSAIIPCRDRPDLLAVALESVARQGWGIEAVVVDDGSKVPLEASLAGRFPWVRFVRTEMSRGAAAARNAGLEAARGRFVAFLDSDDQWLDGHIDRALSRLLDARRHGRRIMVIAAVVRRRDGRDLGVRPSSQKQPGRALGDWLWIDDGFVQTSGFVVERDLALSLPFDVARRTQQDLAWLLGLEASGVEIVTLAEPGAIWNDDRRPDRLTHGSKAEMWTAFSRNLPDGWLSPKAKAACRFSGSFEALVKARRMGELADLVGEAARVLGAFWVMRWISRRCLGRLRGAAGGA